MGRGGVAPPPAGFGVLRTGLRDGGRAHGLRALEASLGGHAPDAPGSQVCPRGGALAGPGTWWAGLSACSSLAGVGVRRPLGECLLPQPFAASVAADRSDPTLGSQRGWGRWGRGGRQEAWVESRVGGFSFLLTFQQKSGSPGLSPQGRVALRVPVLWSGSCRPQSPSGLEGFAVSSGGWRFSE